MRQPLGYNDGSGHVCRLKQSLYGLKQAGNIWNKELNQNLQDLGFCQLKSDVCCYLRRVKDKFEILFVWVDDIVSMANNKSRNNLVEKEIGGRFKIKSLSRPTLLLGMHITHDPLQNRIRISQTSYINSLLQKFGLDQANPVTTPMDPNASA